MDPKIFQKVLSDDPTKEEYNYWRKMLHVYLAKSATPDDSKLEVLFVLCGVKSFHFIEECTTFDDALKALDSKFIKRCSAIMMRHKLRTHRQKEGQSIESYLSELTTLVKKCPTPTLTADQHRNLLISDAFVSGLMSPSIRQRLLESAEDKLESLVQTALTMELATEDAKKLSQCSINTNTFASLSEDTSSLPNEKI